MTTLAETNFSGTSAGSSRRGKQLHDFLGESLTAGAVCKSSSQHKKYAAGNAVDGLLSEDSRWICDSEDTGSIEFDLGTEKTIASLWVVTGWQGGSNSVAMNFNVQVRHGTKWKTVPGGEVRGNTIKEVEIVFDEPIFAQHFRIESVDKGYFRLYEFAAFDRILEIKNEPDEFGVARVCREVATERDLLNIHGTFYELPARNAQGLSKIRPIATHELAVHDYCSHAGLLFFTGLDDQTTSEHIFRSKDGVAAVWAGVVDDLWKLGKPRGTGGPWFKSVVEADQPSDPYLMTAYDQKKVTVFSTEAAAIRLEVDIDGTGLWIPYQTFHVKPNDSVVHDFPGGFSAYWVRAVSDTKTVATVQFEYR